MPGVRYIVACFVILVLLLHSLALTEEFSSNIAQQQAHRREEKREAEGLHLPLITQL